MRWLYFLSLGIFILPCSGQNLTISAKAIDKDTKEPLSFASIGIKGKPIGTVSNLGGEFDFHFPEAYKNEIFVISMVGYDNYQMQVAKLIELGLTEIPLAKSNTFLKPVVVSDSLTGGDIMLAALVRVDMNHPERPFMMDGFYRDVKKIGGTYVSLLESAIKLFDEDYSAPRNKFKLRERVQLLEIRRSLGYSHKFTSYFDEDNLLEELLLHNNIRYRQFPEEEIFFSSLSRGKNTTYDGVEVFVIMYNEEFKLQVLVDAKTYGILHMEYENNHTQPINKKRGLISKFEGLRKVIDYKYYNGKLYLNYMNVWSKINWYDIKTDKLKFETELEQQLMINSVFPETEERVTSKMHSYGLQYHNLPYNKKFWESYNMIKESPLDKKIIADLEIVAPLEKQFEKY